MRPHLHYPALLLLAFGCTTGKSEPQGSEDSATAWWEEGVDGSDDDSTDDSDDKPDDSDDDSGDKPDDSDDKPDDSGDKPDESDVEDCPPDFNPNDTCEGDWTDTLCIHEGMMWWCEDGTWMNEDDKP